MTQRITLFITLLIAIPLHAAGPSKEKREQMQQRCLQEVQAFLVEQGYRARTEPRTTQDTCSSDDHKAQPTTAKLSRTERQDLQAACVAEVQAFLKQSHSNSNPVLSEREMIQALQSSGYTVRNGAVRNSANKVVIHIQPLEQFKEWYLEWLKAQRLTQRANQQSNESPFRLQPSDFPRLSTQNNN